MYVGVVVSQADSGTDVEAIRRWATSADAAGFHHSMAYDHVLGAPLVAGAIAASTLARGSTVVGVVFLLIAIGLVVLAIVLHRRPATEMRISEDLIEVSRPGRTLGSLSYDDIGGRVDVRRHIFRGRAFWSLSPAGSAPRSGIPVDGFAPEVIRSAAEQHGWIVTIVE